MKKGLFNTMKAHRDSVASALDRCHTDENKKLILGAKLYAWETAMEWARGDNCHNGGTPRLVRIVVNGLLKKAKKKMVLVCLDSKDQYHAVTKDTGAINAYYETLEEIKLLVA